jgi:hypothetical protein
LQYIYYLVNSIKHSHDCGAQRPDSQCTRRASAEVKQRMGDQKIYDLELLHPSEDTLSRSYRLHLQSLAPTKPHRARVVG